MQYCIVKKPTTIASLIPVAIILIIAAVLCFVLAPIYPYATIFIAAAGIVLALWLLPRATKSEYEYSIEGDLFTVAVIQNKASRKELFSGKIDDLISCVPFDERDMSVNVAKSIKAQAGENTLYYALFTHEEATEAIVFSPSDEFVNSLRLLAPRKVKCNILH